MDRKKFLMAALGRNVATTQSAGFSGLQPYTGDWTVNEVTHLLKRTMFGAKKADIDHFLSMTVNDAVEELINTVSTPSPPLRDYGLIEVEDTMYDDVGVPLGQTWVNDLNLTSPPEARPQINALRMAGLRKWWAGVILHQQRSIQEKMLLFWHHHYSVQQEEVGNSQMMYRHHNLLRTHVLGNVKTLAREVTIDPAMLLHLNGYLNSKLAPDENYAREFQELFTIGLGNDSHFTENDVIAAARVLTGWRIRNNPLESYIDTSAHDTGSKSFSSFYNSTTIGGGDAAQELTSLVNMIFATDEAARFICRKLYKWFVYYEIDAATETDVIQPLATLLKNNNYEIKPVLLALFKSQHFFDPLNQACYIKGPYDILAGTLREFNVNFPAYTDYAAGYPLFFSVYNNAAIMQQDLFQPPDVSGYAAYTQGPMHYELWVNSNSLPRRADFTDALVNDAVIDVRAFANLSATPADPDLFVDDMVGLLLRYPLSTASKTYVKRTFLLNNGTDNSVWTNAWNSNNTAVTDPALKNLFKFIMNLPEFHLC
ncbi:DUF1800 family protein [Ferruginibacter sp. HRS2-29]|uniref:DUF1800 domain-containing protein n=1 Tax=Ferruginibacter sp. HRS2-29 TaxID=2487334 RepID=UPI0020CC846E|nr:DUF1800 domain-containing protein [Ferruginibacter sp. HRS2-29]